MPYVRGFCFVIGVFMVCAAQADTIPTLTATSADLRWPLQYPDAAPVSGPDFNFFSTATYPFTSKSYPCSLPAPAGGCVAPGPTILLQYPGPLGDAQGSVTIDGVNYTALFEGNAQIQYLTPTIVYPDLSVIGINNVNIPVVLSGTETACLQPDPNIYSCLAYDKYGQPLPGYPKYLANISINVPGILNLEAVELSNNSAVLDAHFYGSGSVPEPTSMALACLGFSVLAAAGYRRRRRRTQCVQVNVTSS